MWWPFKRKQKKPYIRQPGEPRGRVGLDTSGGQHAVAKGEPVVEVKVYRAKEDKWYALDELNKIGN